MGRRRKEKTMAAKVETVQANVSATKEPESNKHDSANSDQVGFICPRCKFPMRVYRTKTLYGAVLRERICDRCGHKPEEPTEERFVKD